MRRSTGIGIILNLNNSLPTKTKSNPKSAGADSVSLAPPATVFILAPMAAFGLASGSGPFEYHEVTRRRLLSSTRDTSIAFKQIRPEWIAIVSSQWL
jgi:hypothetical protein